MVVPKANGESERFGVYFDHLDNRGAFGCWLMPACWHKMVERRAVQCKVGAPIEFRAVRAVHFSPASLAIGPEPKVRLFEVSKEQKLSDFPHW